MRTTFMKKLTYILLIYTSIEMFSACFNTAFAQQEADNIQAKTVRGKLKPSPLPRDTAKLSSFLYKFPKYGRLDPSLGYLFGEEYQAVKLNLDYRDLLWDRLGVYTSFEANLLDQVNYHQIIFGGSVKLFDDFYIFGGLGNRLGAWRDDIRAARKEIGFIFQFDKGYSARFGFSHTMGFTGSVGVPLPLRDKEQVFPVYELEMEIPGNDSLLALIWAKLKELDCYPDTVMQASPVYAGLAPVSIATVYFRTDKYDISYEDRKKLTDVAVLMDMFPESYAIVRGFTDRRGPVEHNRKLRRSRAKSVISFFERQYGIKKDRFQIEEWIIPQKSSNYMYLNRRTQIELYLDSIRLNEALDELVNEIENRSESVTCFSENIALSSSITSVFFDAYASELSYQDRKKLAEIAVVLLSNEKSKLLIRSFDLGQQSNQKLAMQRAETIKAFFLKQYSLPEERICLTRMEGSATSVGHEYLNNRTQIQVIGYE